MLLILSTRLQVGAQLSTVGVSGRKVSRSVQRIIQKPEQYALSMPQVYTSVCNEGERENNLSVRYRIRKPLFHPPLKRIRVTSSYGKRYHPISGLLHVHNGVDLESYYEPVMAVAPGKVIKVGYGEKAGLFVILDHGKGVQTYYAHLHRSFVTAGKMVNKGETIGISGNTGKSTAPHLHFCITIDNVFYNPMEILEKKFF